MLGSITHCGSRSKICITPNLLKFSTQIYILKCAKIGGGFAPDLRNYDPIPAIRPGEERHGERVGREGAEIGVGLHHLLQGYTPHSFNTVTRVYWSRYDKPPLAARCCHVANDFTNFTGDRQTDEQTNRRTASLRKAMAQ